MILDDSGLDTHYVVNGQWTVKNIQVERNTVIELNSVVMPGSSLDAGVKIEPLSCVMPGERLMTGRWRGNPVALVDSGGNGLHGNGMHGNGMVGDGMLGNCKVDSGGNGLHGNGMHGNG